MASARVFMEVGSDGVAVITMSNPPFNELALSIITGLKEKYVEAMNRNDVKAIVLTGDNGKFSGGFDINVFAEIHKTGVVSILSDMSADLVVNTIEDAKKPSVAAIQGLALGGGLDLTLGCHARISTPDAQLGSCELTLGIIPAFGGTQRLPRLMGVPKAIDMMLLSESIQAKEGKEHGLIDAIASPNELLVVARQWALEITEKRKPWISSLHQTDILGSLSEARQIVQAARENVKRTSPHTPQHQVCLDAIEEGIVFGGYAGVLKEARLFKDLVLSATARNLVHAILAQRSTLKKSPASADSQHLRPRL